jgi:hypothetical protein
VNTVVSFVWNRENIGRADPRNKLYTRSLRKVGVIDNRSESGASPKNEEHWLVKIVRENQSSSKSGGCFVLRPLRMVPELELSPLLHGMYEFAVYNDSVVLTPHDQTKFWVMSVDAKISILDATKARSFVINHGGPLWERRSPASSALAHETNKLNLDD